MPKYADGTIGAKLHKFLWNHALNDSECDAILDEMVEKCHPGIEKALHSRPEDYLDSMLPVMILTARAAAVKWIDANKPNHFMRPALASGDK